MYHIDVSHLGSNSEDPAEKKQGERGCNDRYESIIVQQINQKQSNSSGCFFCCSEVNPRIPIDTRKIIEVMCNGLLSCHFCEISEEITDEIFPEDFIIVKQDDTYEICQVKLIGEIVKMKRQALGMFGEKLPVVIRKATADDLETITKNYQDEQRAEPIFRKAIEKFNLNMKLVSIHFQFDRKKLFFFYTSDSRVDFRELAKELASEFKTRIELRQIGVRDEAKKVGGVGTCGREYCCVSFLSSFKRITTQLANEQNLLSSMGKLSGPCNKLKCCLSFDVE